MISKSGFSVLARLANRVRLHLMFPRIHRNRSLQALLLAVILVVAQLVALGHGVAHVAALAAGEDPALPHTLICEQCNQASNLGTGMPPAAFVFFAAPCFEVPPVQNDSVFRACTLPPFSSRAPPDFL
ncbi:MAG: hypothetical protein EXR36_04505 [Betaproteobacteria bacterium]|nr:hypothetical protein [Betaproteobacteria bacterium]